MATYVEAAKNRWSEVPKDVRSERMSHLAKIKQSKMTKEEKTAFGKYMRSFRNEVNKKHSTTHRKKSLVKKT